jgi:hypothetical protein
MQLHIDRVSEIARRLLGLLADDGLALSTEEFQVGFDHGMSGATEPAPWYRRGKVADNYMRGLRAGNKARAALTTQERD